MSDSIAIALVVDSSLALASEWQQVLSEYISPILQRLRELYGVRPQNASTPPKLQFLDGDERIPFLEEGRVSSRHVARLLLIQVQNGIMGGVRCLI